MDMKPIAHIENDYKEKFGIPRQSGLIRSAVSKILFEPDFRDSNAVRGLEGYSHLWIIWLFSENTEAGWSPTVRPPRLGGNVRMGVFATRSPFRPNPIGLSCVEIDRVEHREDGPVIYVRGADLMDGTPILDIKPYVPYADSYPEARAGFAGAVFDHHMKVDISDELLHQIPSDKREGVLEMLAQDPRPGYQRNTERVYGIEYGDMNLRFLGKEDRIQVISVEHKNDNE